MPVRKATAVTAAIFGITMLGAWIAPRATDDAQAFGARDVSQLPSATLLEPTHQLRSRLKPLLSEAAEVESVADGFQTAEDFAATVHAAKNIKVRFFVLKYQVVDEGKALAAAIHTVKPAADASLEADLARSEARADLSAIK
jgi:hypothetical protein